jgi:hypothetical protein
MEEGISPFDHLWSMLSSYAEPKMDEDAALPTSMSIEDIHGIINPEAASEANLMELSTRPASTSADRLPSEVHITPSSSPLIPSAAYQLEEQNPIPFPIPTSPNNGRDHSKHGSVLFVLLPLLIVLATLLFLLLVFLIAVLVSKRKKGIR